MQKFALLIGLASIAGATAVFSPAPAENTIPDLSFNGTGWSGDGENQFLPPKSGPGPVTDDPAHPYVSNFQARRTGEAPNWRVADLTNPILKPWVVEALRKQNENALAGNGKAMFTREARCWPQGVPAMLLNPILMFFVQTPKEVWILQLADHRVRRIYLNQPHTAHPKPSWFGESVGHYEGGDTLVVDTIGMNDKSYVDSYNTPHTDQRRVKARLEEEVCSENNATYFNYDIEPLPQADKPDF
jgi:hypothetical protein